MVLSSQPHPTPEKHYQKLVLGQDTHPLPIQIHFKLGGDNFRKKSQRTIAIKVRLDSTSGVRREWAMIRERNKEDFWTWVVVTWVSISQLFGKSSIYVLCAFLHLCNNLQ